MARVSLPKPIPEYEKPFMEKLIMLGLVVLPLLGVLLAIVQLWQRYVDARDLVLLVTFYVLTGLGITVGFHRLLTHKSFETFPLLKAFWLICGSMALEGNPIRWASTHIQHHAHADDAHDPHSPLVSLWHAHVGWLFDFEARPDIYGTWLKRDAVVVWVDRYWVLWGALGLLIPTLIAGWSGLLWGGLVRLFITHHITWAVNSICHTFGDRPYRTRDASRNQWFVGIFAFGEGWHNNHHAFPRSAYHGLEWWQIDVSAYLIRAMAALGLAWNVQTITETDKRKRRTVQESAREKNQGAFMEL